jgi:hypothetical protein
MSVKGYRNKLEVFSGRSHLGPARDKTVSQIKERGGQTLNLQVRRQHNRF